MPEEFLLLSRKDRNEILSGISQKTGRSALVLEKDVWVCWVLDAISTVPGELPIAFLLPESSMSVVECGGLTPR